MVEAEDPFIKLQREMNQMIVNDPIPSSNLNKPMVIEEKSPVSVGLGSSLANSSMNVGASYNMGHLNQNPAAGFGGS